MELLNLTLLQWGVFFGVLGAGLVALYFYERARRRLRVSTARFFPRRPAPAVRQRSRRLRQPLSLLLQLLALLLLTLALADLRFGGSALERSHVVVLDASAAMRADGLMEQGRQRALDYLRALPSGDPVMLIRASGLAEVSVGFSRDRRRLEEAIRETAAGWTALDLNQAFEAARDGLRLTLGAPGNVPLRQLEGAGEVSYIGPGRLVAAPLAAESLPYLRYIEVDGDLSDALITRFAAERSPQDASLWSVSLALRNDFEDDRSLRAELTFRGRAIGERTLRTPAHQEAEIEFRVRTRQAGALEVVIDSDDGVAENNRARLELPAPAGLPLEIVTSRPQSFERLLAAAPRIEPSFVAEPSGGAAVVLFDRTTALANLPAAARAIWILPPAEGSPIAAASRTIDAQVAEWALDHPLGRGLRDRDYTPAQALVLTPEAGDVVIARSAAGPLAVGREREGGRRVVLGFDLLADEVAERLASPLLFANAMQWLAPEAFRQETVRAGSPGRVELEIGDFARDEISVRAADGPAPPWIVSEGKLRFWAANVGEYSATTPLAATRLALSLPAAGAEEWTPPEGVLSGVPGGSVDRTRARIWPWLALAAMALLAYDWQRFGRDPSAAIETSAASEAPLSIAPDRGARRDAA